MGFNSGFKGLKNQVEKVCHNKVYKTL